MVRILKLILEAMTDNDFTDIKKLEETDLKMYKDLPIAKGDSESESESESEDDDEEEEEERRRRMTTVKMIVKVKMMGMRI